MPTLARVTAVFQHRSGLPRDQISNSFWFHVVDGSQATLAEVADRVQDFYSEIPAGGAMQLSRFFAPTLPDNGHMTKVYLYDMATGDRTTYADAPPDFSESMPDLAAPRNTSQTMPSEVALCLSYRNTNGATPDGVTLNAPAARRRGRVYLGPFTIGESVDEATTEIARPHSSLTLLARQCGAALEAKNDATAKWVVYSRPYAGRAEISREGRAPLPALPARFGQAYVVDQVWTDDAWDTQRRRGERATSRTYL